MRHEKRPSTRLLAWAFMQYRRRRIYGWVIDWVSGVPIEGCQVTLITKRGKVVEETLTDEEGRYRFAGIRWGQHTVVGSHQAYRTGMASSASLQASVLHRVQQDLTLGGISGFE